ISEMDVTPAVYSLVADTRPLPARLHSAAIVVSWPLSGYRLSIPFRRVTAPGSVSASTLPEVSPPLARIA
ncbi:MAG: hypothetical protein M0P29_01960, partial [Sphaerochaetaceae bacterium]|nr:hypothetical protein [Sphaerochaetaceae bacterium]